MVYGGQLSLGAWWSELQSRKAVATASRWPKLGAGAALTRERLMNGRERYGYGGKSARKRMTGGEPRQELPGRASRTDIAHLG